MPMPAPGSVPVGPIGPAASFVSATGGTASGDRILVSFALERAAAIELFRQLAEALQGEPAVNPQGSPRVVLTPRAGVPTDDMQDISQDGQQNGALPPP